MIRYAHQSYYYFITGAMSMSVSECECQLSGAKLTDQCTGNTPAALLVMVLVFVSVQVLVAMLVYVMVLNHQQHLIQC